MGSRRIVTVEILSYIPTLNEYINAERRHRLRAARLKRTTEKQITLELIGQKIKPFDSIFLSYNCIRPHRREDKDNISFGQKFVQDALMLAGIITNDGWNKVVGFSHDFNVDKEQGPKLILSIEER